MNKLVVGILAHVDAGKTTLSESLLFLSGSIRKAGRVDHGDAFLDTHDLERARGITIFSKQAMFSLGDREITLLDTPGHVDFSTEMERTLQVLDYAILVINGADGVQGHTMTLWKLLEEYRIPTFLFVNKMDQLQADKEGVLAELKKRLSDGCMDFGMDLQEDEMQESLALCEEELMERYLEGEPIETEDIKELIWTRKVFPCFFGSALKNEGVEAFLNGLDTYVEDPAYPEAFGAKIFKISRDDQGNRLTHMKITGGSLKVKSMLSLGDGKEEKADQLRVYSGSKFEVINEACAGTVVAVTGLSDTKPGQGLGIEEQSADPVLEPVLTYQIVLPDGCDVHVMLKKLQLLEEEDPALRITWNTTLGEIYAHVMGEVQIEILKSLIAERFGVDVEFGKGNIVYKETVLKKVEGVGHFEPLRHYAEAHLILEPLPRGSGMVFAADCSEDVLDRNWQRLILTHLYEKEHLGVLTGSPITDMKITLTGGRAHLKHTEGGDFRQATYRAVRQGLKEAGCALLEPWYQFRLEVPSESIGRAMADVQRMSGQFEAPLMEGEMTILTGSAPVSEMRDYQTEVVSYTKGCGRLFCSLKGYELCHNAEEVVEAIGYDSESDVENPTGSVFCAHGAGYNVSWDKVKEMMHVESTLKTAAEPEAKSRPAKPVPTAFDRHRATTKELEEIFFRTYGPTKRERFPNNPKNRPVKKPMVSSPTRYKKPVKQEEYLLVDGYNIIFAWDELKELAKVNIDGARDRLIDILCNYQGYKKCTLILVFDAYRVEGHKEEINKHHNIYVVFTKEAETADQYIEKTVHKIGKNHNVTVATSDGLEQVIIRGEGGRLLSAREFAEEVEYINREIRREVQDKRQSGKNYLVNHMDEELAEKMERVRLGIDKEL